MVPSDRAEVTVKYRELGKTGVLVSELCLGTAFRSQDDESTCIRIIDRARDLGCNFIDTALYGGGRSEHVVGRALKGKRDGVVLTLGSAITASQLGTAPPAPWCGRREGYPAWYSTVLPRRWQSAPPRSVRSLRRALPPARR